VRGRIGEEETRSVNRLLKNQNPLTAKNAKEKSKDRKEFIFSAINFATFAITL